MAISSDSPIAREAAVAATSNGYANNEPSKPAANGGVETPSKSSIDTFGSTDLKYGAGVDNTVEFSGEVNTDNEIPSQDVLRRVENFNLLDRDGKTIPFKSLYNGSNVARRVLIIFIRHFFCGNCQEYMRSVAASITPSDLLQLSTPTFIAVVGCGTSSLIPMYQAETKCPFPIYADPTKKLYGELGMLRTLNLGGRPEYQRRTLASMMMGSFLQSLKMLKSGNALKGGGYQQVGGEFLFEPVNMSTPICSPDSAVENNTNMQLGEAGDRNLGGTGYVEEKRITWCHRMRNTRDHVEIPELREVLGMDGEGVHGKDRKRWSKALLERKGTGLSQRTESFSTSNHTGGSSGRQSSEKMMDSSHMN